MKRKNCIFRIIIGGLLALLLAVNLWFLGMKLLLNRDLPKLFGFSQAEVLSGSMEPTFFAGDMLIFQTKKEYLVGDIVIFRQNNSFITHRILDQTEEGLITKGDANNVADKEVLLPENIEGSLILILPHLGTAFTFVRSPLCILIITLCGFALFELPELCRKQKEKQSSTNEINI